MAYSVGRESFNRAMKPGFGLKSEKKRGPNSNGKPRIQVRILRCNERERAGGRVSGIHGQIAHLGGCAHGMGGGHDRDGEAQCMYSPTGVMEVHLQLAMASWRRARWPRRAPGCAGGAPGHLVAHAYGYAKARD